MKIYIASDHAGFDLKNKLFEYLKSKNYEIFDKGPAVFNADDDYPDYVNPVMKIMQKDDKSILVCKNGVGVCIAANKFPGIRATLSFNTLHAKSARTDDDANVLCLGSDYIDLNYAKEIVDVWLETKFSEEERHVRRLNKIKK